MSSIRIIDVESRANLKRFIRFPLDLYAGCPYYVPSLNTDEWSMLARTPDNPLYENCDARLFLAERDGAIVGRLAAIINRTANETFKTKNIRFGWFDVIDDLEVTKALFAAAEGWGCQMGMETMTGPLGFTGFDKAGLLVDGFEYLPTIATSYNHPYYGSLIERCGFEKEIDTIEHLIRDLAHFPPRLKQFAEAIKARGRFRLLELPSRRYLLSRADEVLNLMDDVFSELFDAFPLTPNQRQFYSSKFFPYLNPKLVKIVLNSSEEMIGFFIAMPSLSKAFQKTKGRLFPFGLYHLWRGTRPGNPLLDFCIGGVRKKYRHRGIELLMGMDLFRSASEMGFTMAETNPELETNVQILSTWREFDHIKTKLRRIYTKSI